MNKTRTFVLLAWLALSASAYAQIQLDYEEIETGFFEPVVITHAGDGSDRLFIVERRGDIHIIDISGPTPTVLPTKFLNLGFSGENRITIGGSEQGLLGLAFHPDYPSNGKFYVNYTKNGLGSGDTIIAEYTVSANPNVANPTENVILGPIDQFQGNHNGGNLVFGPDGFLYIGLGDGGGGGDNDDPAHPEGHGQNTNTILGTMLRIDVDNQDPGLSYAIPNDNPFAPGGTNPGGGLEEIYAYGLRNPWRYSFDRGTGRLFCGDVGQGAKEEVSIIQNGDNMGWRTMEGFNCFSPLAGCNQTGLTLPITDYGRGLGFSVTGGYVYRGQSFSGMVGVYLFGDFGTGRIWSLEETSPGVFTRAELDNTNFSISTFGEDEAGELYLAHYGGVIYRLIDLNSTSGINTSAIYLY